MKIANAREALEAHCLRHEQAEDLAAAELGPEPRQRPHEREIHFLFRRGIYHERHDELARAIAARVN